MKKPLSARIAQTELALQDLSTLLRRLKERDPDEDIFAYAVWEDDDRRVKEILSRLRAAFKSV